MFFNLFTNIVPFMR